MFVQQLFNGILLGSMYALLAISYTLVLGVLGKLNLAQGEILTVGALVSLSVWQKSGSIVLAFLFSITIALLLSLLIEYFCFYLPRGDTQVVTTIAMSLVLQNIYTEIWGSEPLRFPRLLSQFNMDFGILRLSATQVLLLSITVVLMLLLTVLIDFSRFGREMRGLASNPWAARVLGVNIRATTVKTFALSGLIAGASGVMAGLVFSSVTPFIGGAVAEKAMIAMVIGGTGSALGAGAAGIFLGIAEILSVSYLGAQYREIIIFPLLMAFLWFRPTGLFRKGQVNRA